MTSFVDWLTGQRSRPDAVGSAARRLAHIDPRTSERRVETPGEVWAALGGGRRGKELRDAIHVARLEWEKHSGHRP